jgi:hypothetical protein
MRPRLRADPGLASTSGRGSEDHQQQQHSSGGGSSGRHIWRRRLLPRADVLILGGDLAYPNPSTETYEQRFFAPFEAALPPPPVRSLIWLLSADPSTTPDVVLSLILSDNWQCPHGLSNLLPRYMRCYILPHLMFSISGVSIGNACMQRLRCWCSCWECMQGVHPGRLVVNKPDLPSAREQRPCVRTPAPCCPDHADLGASPHSGDMACR